MGKFLKEQTGIREIYAARLITAAGICATCSRHLDCMYLKHARGPVWFCDEFDENGENDLEEEASPAAKNFVAAMEPDQRNSKEGLCANCENGRRCVLRRPEGTMYCEEYR